MAICVDCRDDKIGVCHLPWINIQYRDTFFPGMPLLVIDSDLIVNHGYSCSERRRFDVSKLGYLVRERSSCLQVH